MEQINASKFKEQCLALLDNLDPEGIVITKHGKPVARLIPASSDCADLIAHHRLDEVAARAAVAGMLDEQPLPLAGKAARSRVAASD